jgi:hypothetical protein
MESHEERAEELERHADWLEQSSDRVGDLIKDTREDWESKKSSQQAPGAVDRESAAPGGLGEEEENDEDDADQDGGDEDEEDEDADS